MIPIQLELTNFLSYRERAVVDFRQLHLACIAGLNGAGKSSILDAMTWALFGKCRSRSDDDVVNRAAYRVEEGAMAEVYFTFALEDQVYRVIRRKRLGRSGELELQLATADGGWKSLSEGKMRETQGAIEQLLHMSYDVFVNASFLIQGRADEFTTKTPNQRKEILADILGVSQWERYRVAAADRRKQTEAEALFTTGRLEEIEAELAEEAERRQALADAEQRRQTIEAEKSVREQLLDQKRRTEQAAQQQKEQVKRLLASLNNTRRDVVELEQGRSKRQQELAAYEGILAEREQILADHEAWQAADAEWQSWEEKAREYNRKQHEKRPHEIAVTQARSRLEQQVQQLESQAERVAAAIEERLRAKKALEENQQKMATAAAAIKELADQEAAWREAQRELERLESDLRLWTQERDYLREQQRKTAALEKERPSVAANLQAAKEALAAVVTKLEKVTEQNERYMAVLSERDTLQSEQKRLEAEGKKIRSRMDQLQAETGSVCPTCGQDLSPEHREQAMAQLQAERDVFAAQFSEVKGRIGVILQEAAELDSAVKRRPALEKDREVQQQRLARAEARMEEIEKALAEWQANGSADRLSHVEQTLGEQDGLEAKRERVAQLAQAAQGKAQHEQAYEAAQKIVSRAEARLEEIERITADWEQKGKGLLAETCRQLNEGDYAQEAQAALAELDKAIAAIGYEAAAHEAARAKRQGLAAAPDRFQALRRAEAAIKPLQESLADLEQRLARQMEAAEELSRQHEEAVAQLALLEEGTVDLEAVERDVFQLREEASLAMQAEVAARLKVEVLDDLRTQQLAVRETLRTLNKRAQEYQMLEKAFGRNGVQALLIEHARPEIEERANELLYRLTGGAMRVTLETQRQLKSRKDTMAETLEIKISDGVGTRPYENYSGGEQFRVNFAIRLALSQVLAKRAGARLQTLVIDEGFGSQDPEGRQRLVEAINAIQNDFACILVITHVAELRDAFPVRIEVEKTAAGSRVQVIES